MPKISKARTKIIIADFIERGWHNSPSGLTGQIVLDWLRENPRAYRLTVVPGVSAWIELTDHPKFDPSASSRMLQMAREIIRPM